jgi:hypothetical protein
MVTASGEMTAEGRGEEGGRKVVEHERTPPQWSSIPRPRFATGRLRCG